jgi:hypothetical protein
MLIKSDVKRLARCWRRPHHLLSSWSAWKCLVSSVALLVAAVLFFSLVSFSLIRFRSFVYACVCDRTWFLLVTQVVFSRAGSWDNEIAPKHFRTRMWQCCCCFVCIDAKLFSRATKKKATSTHVGFGYMRAFFVLASFIETNPGMRTEVTTTKTTARRITTRDKLHSLTTTCRHIVKSCERWMHG